jgi:outer membrane protein assembly factor BamB
MNILSKISIFRSGPALALVAGLLAPAAAMAYAPALHDGVLIDAAAGAAYVMSPKGGIEALELATGNVLWKSLDAGKPLLVQNGTLVAQAAPDGPGKLVLVALDARRGATRERVNVPIPASLRANLADGPSQSFRTQAFAAEGSVVVTWTAEDGRTLRGVLPPTEESTSNDSAAPVNETAAAKAGPQPLRGAARLDLGTGQAVAMKYEEALQAQAVSVRTPFNRAADLQQLGSLDGKHILSSERSKSGSLAARYRWTVTDKAGATVGTVEAPVSMAPFVVSGTRLFYVAQPLVRKEGTRMVQEPLRLRSLDLQTGTELWNQPVIDSTYRGPFPP